VQWHPSGMPDAWLRPPTICESMLMNSRENCTSPRMEWETVTERLEEVERQIATNETMIANAREKLEHAIELELDPAEGEKALGNLEAVQRVYLLERDELKEALRRLAN
jgi:hypothetical protein